MAQRRMLSKRISQSKKVNSLSIKAQIVWTWTIPWLDDYGCYTADIEDIKTEIFPKNKSITIQEINDALLEEMDLGLVIIFTLNGKDYQKYANFEDFQTLKSDRPKKSDIKGYYEGMELKGIQRKPKEASGSPEVKLSKVKLREDIVATQEFRLSEYLVELIKERNDNFKQPNLEKWAENIGLMIRIDKRDPEEIKEVIGWCQQDEFWQDNILCTSKLRKQYDQLIMKMNKGFNNQANHKGNHVEYQGRNWADVRKEKMEDNGPPLQNKARKKDVKGEGKRSKHLKKWREDKEGEYAKAKK